MTLFIPDAQTLFTVVASVSALTTSEAVLVAKSAADLGCDATGPALPVDLILRTVHKGYKVESIFIPYRERIGQSTMQPMRSAYWTAKRILGARFS